MKSLSVIIISGPMGAGKSTIAKLLHEKMPKNSLLSIDKIKRTISDYKSGDKNQIRLSFDICMAMASIYIKKRVIEYFSHQKSLLIS